MLTFTLSQLVAVAAAAFVIGNGFGVIVSCVTSIATSLFISSSKTSREVIHG